jgi:CRP/FNR family transcriptional regulator, global nitrogen regulator
MWIDPPARGWHSVVWNDRIRFAAASIAILLFSAFFANAVEMPGAQPWLHQGAAGSLFAAAVTALLGSHTLLQKKECRRLLTTLAEMGVATTGWRYDPGEIIYCSEEPADGLYIVTEGVIKVAERHSGGREATLRLLQKWDIFGRFLTSVGVESRYHAAPYAESVTHCEIEKVPKVFAERALRLRPEVARSLATMLELRLIEREELMRCVLPRKTAERLARLLPLLARKFGESPKGGPTMIRLRLTHQDLADMVTSTRESVTAALISLRRQKIIEVDRGCIVLLDPEKLAKIASMSSSARVGSSDTHRPSGRAERERI